MRITDGLLSSSRRNTFSTIIDRWSETTTFRIIISIGLVFLFILMIPLFLIVVPFILAWDFAGALMQRLNINKEDNIAPNQSFWGNFESNYDRWKESK